jgi:uncharacterized protein with ParB-like and HNH nuclease domain
MNQDNLKKVAVSEVFNNTNFIIPIYQRNYAWQEEQIEQLIEDIDSSIVLNEDTDKQNQSENNIYFLGNLIVNRKDSSHYEVIDGQQRLTTLFLLQKYLGMVISHDALTFEAREKSNRTLARIDSEANTNLSEELESPELRDGIKIIKAFFERKKIDQETFRKKLDSVFLIQVQVPEKIDLNHYFEVMNTRGEQLELHEIAKGKILGKLNPSEMKAGAMIWECCSIMDSYVQMNFKKEYRDKIFTSDWTGLSGEVSDFDSIVGLLNISVNSGEEKSLLDIITKEKIDQGNKSPGDNESNENERFESILSFPNFLLQVSSADKELEEQESNLDDKKFMSNLKWAWESTDNAKRFLYQLLKARVLFDKFILKREFARDYKDTGKWSLQRLEKYSDASPGKSSDKPKYVATFKVEENESVKNKQLRTLQSCLRITYTSPKTMHWITLALKNLLKDEKVDLISLLEKYCQEKVKNSGYENAGGFLFERIVFTYLDYLLYRDGNSKYDIKKLSDDWQFQFRNSIEHFHPQNPKEIEKWEKEDLDGFGNLALVTTSDNSKFSNVAPVGKVGTYPKIIEQSLKLKIMAKMAGEKNDWKKEMGEQHRKEMFEILERN